VSPGFRCTNDECGHRFTHSSRLALYSPCPVCESDVEEETDYDDAPESTASAPPRDRLSQARREAALLLDKHNISELPIPVEEIAEAEGLRIVRCRLEVDGHQLDGLLHKDRIEVNEGQALVRQRFTIAHELGHKILHNGRAVDETAEREADAFAGALLLPAGFLKREFAKTPDPQALCRRFLVSEPALWIALKDHKLDRQLPRR
jgi:Zn-dependent peptidase ImmA (M78 family)